MSRCLLPPDAPEHWCDIRHRTIQVASPAAGADWSVQAPVAEAWSVRGIFAQLGTSAVAATRVPQLRLIDPFGVLLAMQPSQGVAANSTMRFSLTVGGPAGGNSSGGASNWGGPDPFIVWPGYTLAVVTPTIDVADQWSLIALDVLFELNRGAGAAKRFADWRRSQQADLPAQRLRGGAGDPSSYL